jgi:hypothetical protein
MSKFARNANSVSGYYAQNASAISFNVIFDLNNSTIIIKSSIGNINTNYTGKCTRQDFH